MKSHLDADGEFAYTYVIAHEVGHHIENQLGILEQAHTKMGRSNKTEANKISVRLELIADFIQAYGLIMTTRNTTPEKKAT